MKVTCPRCKNKIEYEGNIFRPFCSERCQQIDLGAWLTEKHAVPTEDSGKIESQIESDQDESASTKDKK